MKFLFDLFPVILFFGTYRVFPHFGPKDEAMFYATAVVIVATLAQIVWTYMRRGKVDGMLWMSFAIVLVFGGATLLFHDKSFIMWKPSVLYWCFSAILIASSTWFDKNLIRSMLQEQLVLPDDVWGKVNLSWAAFFAAMGVANLYVALNFSESAWVNFKMFGTLGLMLVFIVVQSLLLSKYTESKES